LNSRFVSFLFSFGRPVICRITFVELEHRRPLQLLAGVGDVVNIYAVVDVDVVVVVAAGDVELSFVEQGVVYFVGVVLDELLIQEGGPALEGVACLDGFEYVFVFLVLEKVLRVFFDKLRV
jgi:hypothetical protein